MPKKSADMTTIVLARYHASAARGTCDELLSFAEGGSPLRCRAACYGLLALILAGITGEVP
jgi:hypothetical protein